MSRLSMLASPTALADHLLTHAERTGASSEIGASHDEAIRLVADFLWRRFVMRDADQYRRWRAAQGFRLKSLEEMDRAWSARKDFSAIFGEEPPDTVEGLFARYWTASPEWHGGANMIIAVASEPRGILCQIADSENPYDQRMMLRGTLGSNLWHGTVSGTLRSWFDPPVTPEQAVRSRGHVATAEIGVIVEAADGSRKPMIFGLAFNQNSKVWILLHINFNNADPATMSPIEF